VDEEHKKRIAMNEATYRKINEAVRAERADRAITFLCECGRLGCNRLIQLTRAEYEAVRSNPRRFALVPGHEILEVEDVVERHERYAVIEKHGDVDDIVKPADPRRPLEE
jgi:5-bromo-4-chloroindolyl phosphate hydrolysis protein